LDEPPYRSSGMQLSIKHTCENLQRAINRRHTKLNKRRDTSKRLVFICEVVVEFIVLKVGNNILMTTDSKTQKSILGTAP